MKKIKNQIIYKCILIIVAFVFTIACKKDNFKETEGICPVVLSTNPSDLETNVSLDEIILVEFNGQMNSSSINASSFILKASINGVDSIIPGSVSYSESTNTLVFIPDNLLEVNKTYLANVRPTVKDISGNFLQKEYSWTFSTSGYITPMVVFTNPKNLDSNVKYDETIFATFNMPMDNQSINTSTFKVLKNGVEINGTVSYGGLIAVFNPNVDFEADTKYTCILNKDIKNIDGTSIQSDYVWTFKTEAISTPTVTDIDPNNGENDVALNKVITALFSEEMDPLSFTATSFKLKEGTNDINGVISVNKANFSFNPDVNLLSNTTYDVEFTTTIKSKKGIFLQNNVTWQFTTGANQAPEIISTLPLNGSSNVAFNQVISATFDQVMDPLTFTNSSFYVNNGNSNITGQISYNGSTISFTPDVILTASTTYKASLTTAVKNPSGLSIANLYEWTFSTNSTGVNLNSAENFGILAGVGITNAAGFSTINNLNVGIYPGVRSSIVGFPPAVVNNGSIFASDDPIPAGVAAMLQQAKLDLVNAYLFAKDAQSPAPVTVAGDQGGKTLSPGIYKSTSTLLIQSGDLTLDAQGDPNAVWIFQIASDFTTIGGAGGNVILSGGAQAKNIYWQTGSSATLGNSTIFKGNILALTSITMNTGAVAEGRMLAQNGSVVMSGNNTISKP